MAIDNSLYDSLENTYKEMKNYLDNTKLGPEHSEMIMQHEELAGLLERLDIEAIEEQTSEIHKLHNELNKIKELSEQIIQTLHNKNEPTVATDVITILKQVLSKTETYLT